MKPTHVERIDALELHNAMLIMEARQRGLDDARADVNRLLAAAGQKYDFDVDKKEGISLPDGRIVRHSVEDADGRAAP